ncbi:MAG: DUF2191 domain-containing protein [Deltaproteobacteria bacterium]|nr:DUF2191 domain-containing protein [Deltaproteobacteria bacterium]
MRTTLTIDDHIMKELKEAAHRSGQPLKRVVNNALRAGLGQLKRPIPSKPYRCKTFSMGYPPRVNLDKALYIATTLEDEEITRKLSLKK